MDTNPDKLAAQLNKFLKVEDGPAFGGGKLSKEDDSLYCALAHPFSLIIWLWKRNESPAVDVHGKEALNEGITLLLFFWLPMTLVLVLLGGILAKVKLLWYLVMIVYYVADLAILAMFIYGAIQAKQGKLVRYPFNLRLIK